MGPTNNAAIEKFRVSDERLTCAPFDLGQDIPPLGDDVLIAQARAEAALRKAFGTPGNAFVVGTDSINSAFLNNVRGKAAASMSADKVCDTICVHNFDNPEKPRFVDLPKREALRFAKEISRLLDALKEEIPKTLGSESFRESENALKSQADAEAADSWKDLAEEERSSTLNTQTLGEIAFTHKPAPQGMVMLFAIVLKDGERPISPEEYAALQESEHEELDRLQNILMIRLQGVIREIEERVRDTEKAIEDLRQEFVDALFGRETEEVIKEYGEPLFVFLDGLRKYTLEHIKAFLFGDDTSRAHMTFPPPPDPFLPFKVNVFVDNSKTKGIPVLDHRNVDYEGLFGEVERSAGPGGVLLGGHTMVRAGLLSRAHRGVLVLSAEDVFGFQGTLKGVWERLKAVLETKRLDIDRVMSGYGNTAPETLQIDVKLVLVGNERLYRDLLTHNQFDEIFKTVVVFDPLATRSPEVVDQLTGLIRMLQEKGELPEVQDDAIQEFLKHLSRKVGDQNKFRLDARLLKDLLHEAAWLAGEDEVITKDHVRQAIRDKEYRVGLIPDRIQELIESGDLILTLEGSEVGQINGLAVYDLGDIAFGRPTRITVTTQMAPLSSGGVINIERESDMSGRTHNKGVLILGGYFGEHFGQDKPSAFTARVVFEQSYEGVDGDSASSTELYAILSSLSGVPLRQDICVTGSVNQKGQIQPIGGATQKIEGVFDVASAFGLTGNQGVVIPHQNVKNLVLRDDVIEAIKKGDFRVWAIETVEEGIEILTGMEAGERDETGTYPEGTLYRLVDDRLEQFLTDWLRRTRSPAEEKPGFFQRLFGG